MNDAVERLKAVMQCSKTSDDNYVTPDIVLVQAPGWGVNTPPLALAQLAAFARMNGYKALPLDLNVEYYIRRTNTPFNDTWLGPVSLWFWNTGSAVKSIMAQFQHETGAFVDGIIATGAKLVGFTIYSSSEMVSLELARMLKERNPSIKIVFGGPQAGKDNRGKIIAESPYVDAVCHGEGELTLIDIIERVNSGRSLDDMPGLVTTEERELIDMDLLPAPDFLDYNFLVYLIPDRLPIQGSRGCVNRCVFCNEKTFWKKFRQRSADKIFAEIQSQLQHYPATKLIDFQDSELNGDMREFERFADLMIESGLNSKVMWGGQTIIRKEMANVELLSKLKRSGFLCGAYGLETTSEPLMVKSGKLAAKGVDVDALVEAHGQSGLPAVYNFMFGLPGETEEDAQGNLEFLRKHRTKLHMVNPSSGLCMIGPGTPAGNNPDLYDIDTTNGYKYWESKDGTNNFLTRVRRFEAFCSLCQELGIPFIYGSPVLLDKDRQVGKYYELKGDLDNARHHYQVWLANHPDDADIQNDLNRIHK